MKRKGEIRYGNKGQLRLYQEESAVELGRSKMILAKISREKKEEKTVEKKGGRPLGQRRVQLGLSDL